MGKNIVAPRIPEYIRKIVILSTVLITVGVGFTFTIQQFVFYQRTSKQMREDVIEKHKQFIKDLVAIEVEYIANQKKEFDNRIADELKESVIKASQVAEVLYSNYHNSMAEGELQKLIITAVSSLRSFSPYSHVFINHLDGRGIYYQGNPEFSGKDLLDMEDRHGNLVVQSEIELIHEKGEGFLNYKLGSFGEHDELTAKVCFVKKLPHYNWYLGSKCYLDDYYGDFKLEIARKISSERFRLGGYVFMNELDGHPVVLDGEVYKGDFNFNDGTDTHRQQVFKEQVEAATSSAEGGYFSYKWNKIGEEENSEKISYASFFKPCGWIIGAGFYVEDIESEIQNQNAELKKGLLWNIIQILLILAIAVVLELYLLYRFKKNFQADFYHFTRFFRVGKGRYQRINLDKIHFREFRNMGKVANEMIKERARVHEQLVEEQYRAQESDRLKTAFLANMSHEIRTPMNAILGFSELLNDEEIAPEVRKDFVRLILQNGEMLMTLINDIIDIAKIESGQIAINQAEFNLNELLDDLYRHFEGVIEKDPNKDITIEMQNRVSETFVCNSDEFRLKQVLYNLIGNAIKFTTTGSVRVEVELKDGRLYFKIIDTGIGISKEDLKSIFERFMQAGNHLSKHFGGTGLGLAISKNIVNLLGGEIWVESVENQGSEFQFYIPAAIVTD
ncbi:cache domain-containing protein [Mangrovibacterium lignilyticum]|uniref:cache domain-containing protein n=1 Tax=Mangrovibacterium lignilyticum TaxID=2668052 RepID=UPI0013D34A92|nr:cache domain-containing protein [Mangrovibacterium lignilyticum]